MESITERLGRVLRLESAVFPELTADPAATGQGIAVTALAGAISGLTGEGNLVGRIVVGAIGLVVGLFIWTAVVTVVGKLFGSTAGYGELLRPIGYAGAPFALGVVPVIGGIAAFVYTAIIQIRAIREVGGVSDGAAAAIVLIPLAVVFVVVLLLAVLAGVALLFGLEALD